MRGLFALPINLPRIAMVASGVLVLANADLSDFVCTGNPDRPTCNNPRAPGPEYPDGPQFPNGPSNLETLTTINSTASGNHTLTVPTAALSLSSTAPIAGTSA